MKPFQLLDLILLQCCVLAAGLRWQNVFWILCCCLYHISWRESISLFSLCNMNINSLFFKCSWMWYLSPGDDVLLCFLGSWAKSLSQTKQACLPALSLALCECVCLLAACFYILMGTKCPLKDSNIWQFWPCGDIWLVPKRTTSCLWKNYLKKKKTESFFVTWDKVCARFRFSIALIRCIMLVEGSERENVCACLCV